MNVFLGVTMRKIYITLISALAVGQVYAATKHGVFSRLSDRWSVNSSYHKLEHMGSYGEFSKEDIENCESVFFKTILNPSTGMLNVTKELHKDNSRTRKQVGNEFEANLGIGGVFITKVTPEFIIAVEHIAAKYWYDNPRWLLFLAICMESCALEIACKLHDGIIAQDAKGIGYAKAKVWCIDKTIEELVDFIRKKATSLMDIAKKSKNKNRKVRAEYDLIQKELFSNKLNNEQYIAKQKRRIAMYLDAYKPYAKENNCSTLGCDAEKAAFGKILVHDVNKIAMRFAYNTSKAGFDSFSRELQALSYPRTFLVESVDGRYLTKNKDVVDRELKEKREEWEKMMK